ncbi:MAG TPA: urease accessory protein UreD [Casimicrobiaceae bacterium]|nr:urease accessory protein UreD [Casimicrobiaceae bacterium]
MRIQKPLFPEGPHLAHAIVVHPPSGIAGGDALTIDFTLHEGARALITTPGATRWYRTRGAMASQNVHLHAGAKAVLEWLPMESIVYDGARASMSVDVRLEADATFIGMETLCLGRTASAESFRTGECSLATHIVRDGAPLWIERGSIVGNDRLLSSPIGLAGHPVVGTLLAASARVDADLLTACRHESPVVGEGAITSVPGLLIARYLGPGCEPAREWLARVWSRLRPALTGCEPMMPRIWST